MTEWLRGSHCAQGQRITITGSKGIVSRSYGQAKGYLYGLHTKEAGSGQLLAGVNLDEAETLPLVIVSFCLDGVTAAL